MFKKGIFLLVSVVLFFGCKGKNEGDGDSYYKDGKFRNAVNSYTAALQKGKVSKEFYDSFVIAYASAAKQTAKKNASDDLIRSYIEQIHKYNAGKVINSRKENPKSSKIVSDTVNVKLKPSTLDSIVVALSEIGVAQVSNSGGFDYEYTLQGFRNLDSAINIAKRNNLAGLGSATAARKKAEDAIVKAALENSDGAENNIAAEYTLLEAEVVAPNNADLQKALNAVRIKNRADLLLFAEDIIGQHASRLVDKYSYVMAFPILTIASTSTTGEIVIWNATGNNLEFDISAIKMVSTGGKEVNAKYVGGGWCQDGGDYLGKKRTQFKGSVGKLHTELTCNAKLSFEYPSDFVPDYVAYKDKDSNIGRKYFGHK
jgi:hypothetical protein